MKKRIQALVDEIRDIAIENCSDYPLIEECDSFERLYAIRNTIKGTEDANKELHLFIKFIATKMYGNKVTERLAKLANEWYDSKRNTDRHREGH